MSRLPARGRERNAALLAGTPGREKRARVERNLTPSRSLGRSHGLPVAVFDTVVSVRILTVAGAAARARLRVNGKRRRAEPGPPVR